jgi:hypothetical protein
MKKAEEILFDLGFNKHATDATKEAFLRHLFKTANGIEIQKRHSIPKELIIVSKQLTFNLDDHTLKEAI